MLECLAQRDYFLLCPLGLACDSLLSCMCSAVTQLLAEGITACAARCDVTKKTEVDRLVAYTVQQYGGLDILIANAGEPFSGLDK